MSQPAPLPADTGGPGDKGGLSSFRGLLIGMLIGAPFMLVGIVGALNNRHGTHPLELARWVIGGALAHDLLFAPVVFAAGSTLRRISPPTIWPVVRWALITCGILVAFSWPFVAGYGRNPTVPSLLARNYGRGLAMYVVAVCVTSCSLAVWISRRRPPRVAAGHGISRPS